MIKILIVVEAVRRVLLALNEALGCPCAVEAMRTTWEAIVVLAGCFRTTMLEIACVVEAIRGVLLALNEALGCPCAVEAMRMTWEAVVALTGCF